MALQDLIQESSGQVLGQPMELEFVEVDLQQLSDDTNQLIWAPAPGVIGRIVILQIPNIRTIMPQEDEEEEEDEIMWLLEEWQAVLSQQMDDILYHPDEDQRVLTLPILLSIQRVTPDEMGMQMPQEKLQEQMLSLLQQSLDDYGLREPLTKCHDSNHQRHPCAPQQQVPSVSYEVDGALVTDKKINSPSLAEVAWDTSSILVFDHLLPTDSNLRQRMLDVVLGRQQQAGDGNNNKEHPSCWDDVANGPDPSRWVSGGLIDIPDQAQDDTTNGIDNDKTSTSNESSSSPPSSTKRNDDDGSNMPVSYGLSEEALEEICHDAPPPLAFQEFEQILVNLFPDVTITRLPEAVLGAGVTPLTANAPCFGQTFEYHIDGDPFFAPPSPWTDVFGRYANRAPGKPRFMSCMIYLNNDDDNERWSTGEWGGTTRFLDVATNTSIDVLPKPGRVVLFDADITHSVVAPLEAAGKRPRYSLVWKLILHPNHHDQDMRSSLSSSHDWPEPTLVGSAKRSQTKNEIIVAR